MPPLIIAVDIVCPIAIAKAAKTDVVSRILPPSTPKQGDPLHAHNNAYKHLIHGILSSNNKIGMLFA